MAVKFNPLSGQFDFVGGGGGGAGSLPVGGVQYDLLVKNSGVDYDAIWSRVLDTLTVNTLLDAPHIHGALAGPVYIHVKNTSGVTIPKGYPVYITGSVGASGAAEIAAADASDPAKMPAIGIIDSALNNNDTGHCTIIGSIGNLDTSAYAINSPVFVAAGGGLTLTRPTATTSLVQNIGRVDRVNASTGQIVVMGPGRSNDVPNTIGVNLIPSTANTYDIGSSTLDWKELFLRTAVYVGQSAGDQTQVRSNYIYYNNPAASTAFQIYTGNKTGANTSGVTIKSGDSATSGISGNIIIQTGTGATARGAVYINGSQINTTGDILPAVSATYDLGSTSFPFSYGYFRNSVYSGTGSSGLAYLAGSATNPFLYLYHTTGTNYCLILTPDRSSGPSNKLLIRTGNISSVGNSGDIELATGTIAGFGTRGTIILNGAAISASSTKITNLANGTVSTDAVALGQLATVATTGSYTDLSNTPATSTGTFTTGIKTAAFALTDAATITTTNVSSYNTFTVTLGGNRTLGSFTTGTADQKIVIRVRQDGTGNRTLSFDSTYWNQGTDAVWLSISPTANSYSYIGAIYNSGTSKWDVVSIVRGY